MSDLEEKEYRVKYFPPTDLAYGLRIEKIEQIYQNKELQTIKDINDAIEFYNFYRYFHDDGIIWKKWSTEQTEVFKKLTEDLKTKTFKYIASLNDSTFISSMDIIEFEYIDDLINLLQNTKFQNISSEAISEILDKNESFIFHAVKNEKFVNHYGDVIKQYLIEKNAAEIIITAEDSKNNDTISKTFIPKCLSENERNIIIENYINSDNVNQNYLSILISIPFEKKLPVPIIVAAQKKLQKCEEELISTAGKICTFTLHFERNQKEKVIISSKQPLTTDISYSLDWILNNLTYDSILYNFVDMFCFVDGQYRIMTMNKPIDSGLIDSLSMLKNNKIYHKNIIFDYFEGLLNNELNLYRTILMHKGIYLETMIESFFSEFLTQNYKLPKITTHLSTENKSYLEKCHELVTNFDIICKQFYHFAKYKTIDKELLQADNTPVKIENIPSLVKNKYAHGSGNNYKGMVYNLFSNQCLLNYISSRKIQSECFYDLLQKETVYKSDYPEYEHRVIEELAKWNLINIDVEGKLSIKNHNRVLVLRELYRNEFLNFNRFDDEMKSEILEMQKLELIEFENTLLSEQEAAYINYYLNETFPNGPKLRNKYAHGIEYLEDDEKVHYNNYIILLRLLILLVLKINDDVCLYHQENNKIVYES